MTAPHVGNTGINDEDDESRRIWVAGYVVRDPALRPSNWRSTALARGRARRPGRRRHLRHRHPRPDPPPARARRHAGRHLQRGCRERAARAAARPRSSTRPPMAGRRAGRAGRHRPSLRRAGGGGEALHRRRGRPRHQGDDAAADGRARHRGARAAGQPPRSTTCAALEPDGVFFSNGPGDPATAEAQVALLREVLDDGIPFFGICFGNQLLGRALGFGTYKLKYGHRGINQPVMDRTTGKVEVTAHNHGFAVDAPARPRHRHAVRHARRSATSASTTTSSRGSRCLDVPWRFSVQYHPEAAAGPHDAAYLFDRFVDLMTDDARRGSAADAEARRHQSVLVIGSGPIVIGQACEFDYSGTQACRVLREEGIRVILVNTNPATIMTDPEFADATYVEPITPEVVEAIIAKERPDAVLATLGGQTALNCAIALHEHGVLEKYDCPLIGANVEAIQLGEDREKFKGVVARCGAESARSFICHSMDEVLAAADDLGYPVVVRPSFTMGGLGSGFAHDEDELRRIAGAGPAVLPDHRGAPRGVDPRLEGVRARGDARPRRQRRGRLLHREPRPDGRAHRRLDHRRPGAHPHRPRVPAAARHRHRHHPRGRRRHRRLQHPVRRQPRRRPDHRHRDEPARLALERPGLQGDRVPDRQDRREDGDRLHARRGAQRHHPRDAGVLRADPRLRRRQGAAVRVREVPGRRPDPDDDDEVGRRGDVDRPQLHRGAAEGAALAGEDGRSFHWDGRAPDHRRRPRRAPRARPGVPTDGRIVARAAGAARRRLGRGGARGHRHRPVVPRPDRAHQRGRAMPGRGRRAAHARPAPAGQAARLQRRPDRLAAPVCRRRWSAGCATPSGCARSTRPSTPARPSSRRSTPYHYCDLRRGDRGRAAGAARGDHPRLRPEPDRPGRRVRLLLRPRVVRLARQGFRHGDGQLQPRDRVHRLRHEQPALLRAADPRGRPRGGPRREPGRADRRRHRAARRADAARPRAGAQGRGRADRRHQPRGHQPRRGPRRVRPGARARRTCRPRSTAPPTAPTRRVEVAKEIGYPVLVRPSYVLGGRGMEIVYDDETLATYVEPRDRSRAPTTRSSSTASSTTRSRSTSTRSTTARRCTSAGSWSTSRRPASTPATAPARCRR